MRSCWCCFDANGVKIELAGIDGFGAALYIGTGCFHRRESLSGKHYENRVLEDSTKITTVEELEMNSKPLADCNYDKGYSMGQRALSQSLQVYKSFIPWKGITQLLIPSFLLKIPFCPFGAKMQKSILMGLKCKKKILEALRARKAALLVHQEDFGGCALTMI